MDVRHRTNIQAPGRLVCHDHARLVHQSAPKDQLLDIPTGHGSRRCSRPEQRTSNETIAIRCACTLAACAQQPPRTRKPGLLVTLGDRVLPNSKIADDADCAAVLRDTPHTRATNVRGVAFTPERG